MIKRDEVKHIATLARIGLAEEEVAKYANDLSGILDWVDELKKVNISGIKPIDHITGMENIEREDRAEVFGDEEKIIKMFPEQKYNFDKVKSVL
ncbi:MAG: Asp-tRNA(Asn)/Glu-tRNA(Gln) amidotransferase subunit GatC [Candidatus Moranbacteria bacterium]|nr:Asp-tRNA(Asn)/Glu-tRNA(Gln) amidotransferase subunit GatC [Candidatus Moranbacteria bacterium]